ncbi:MAG: hypothetical protein Q7O66_02000, partial [Dehalococcoidia bacterium]|nr:hypothetical protein [Dehalococcoidia bacterium]
MSKRLRLVLLATIVAVYIIFGAAYASKTPTWETPDEPAHFNYIRYLAEHRQFPELKVGDYNQDYLEELKANKFPPGKPIDSVRYESWQPPLYYLSSVPLFWASTDLPQSQQVVVLRLFSVFLGVVLLLVSYRIARRVLPKDDLLALAVPGFIAVLPQHLAMTAAVSNDTLSEVVLSLILLVLVERICDPLSAPSVSTGRPQWLRLPSPFGKGEGTASAALGGGENKASVALREADGRVFHGERQIWRSGLMLGVLLGLALLTKSTIYVGAVLIPLGLLLSQLGKNGQIPLGKALQSLRFRPVVEESAIAFVIALALAGWWFVRNAWIYGGLDLLVWRRHDLVVLGQPLAGPFNLAFAKFFVTTTFQSFWAQFGWMGVLADERTYTLLGVLTAIGLVGMGLFLVRIIRHPSSEGSTSAAQSTCL